MNAILKYIFASLALSLALIADPFTAPAPSRLPPCIIEYSSIMATPASGTSRVVIYRADSSFMELEVTSSDPNTVVIGGSNTPVESSPTHSGTYRYGIDPLNPSHAIISYGGGVLPDDNLYFNTPTSGGISDIITTTGGLLAGFVIYPLHTVDSGSVAFSTRCTLVSGGSIINGLAIASGGPRWVLIRAVGASLVTYGVGATVTQPSFTLYDSSGNVVGTSSVWSADPNLVSGYKTVFSMVGEFLLTDGSDEGIMLVPLQPGTYTAVFNATSAGQILCEAYVLPY